jgi:hypothetical protein
MKIGVWSFCLLLLILISYNLKGIYGSNVKSRRLTDTARKSYDQILTELEKRAAEKNTDSLGVLVNTIDFQVKTDDTSDYKDGLIPWINLDQPDKSLPQLIMKDELVIINNKVTVIIDYPLTKEFRFKLSSDTGFTRERLVKEISQAYYKLYEEEENSATIKTIPADKRTMVYNRNQTNGKYGIWGHDIADLVLANILVYKSPNGEVLLSLDINS